MDCLPKGKLGHSVYSYGDNFCEGIINKRPKFKYAW